MYKLSKEDAEYLLNLLAEMPYKHSFKAINILQNMEEIETNIVSGIEENGQSN